CSVKFRAHSARVKSEARSAGRRSAHLAMESDERLVDRAGDRGLQILSDCGPNPDEQGSEAPAESARARPGGLVGHGLGGHSGHVLLHASAAGVRRCGGLSLRLTNSAISRQARRLSASGGWGVARTVSISSAPERVSPKTTAGSRARIASRERALKRSK